MEDKGRRGEGEKKGGLFGAGALAETDRVRLADDLTFNSSTSSSIHPISDTMDTDDIVPEPLFRPAKRRKFVRRRPDDNSEDTTAGDQVADSNEKDGRAASSRAAPDADEDTGSTGVIRLRRPHITRKGGIAFSATSRSGKDDSRQTALGPARDLEKETVQDMCDRFTGHTGQTVDVDRHMYEDPLPCVVPGATKTNKIRMAYIDSQMAKRYRHSPIPQSEDVDRPTLEGPGGPTMSGQPEREREPASLGRLHEIDLGQETKLQNIARTEAATRQMAGDEDSPTPGEPATQTDRPGPSEKQWRNRKRRTSADIERDRLVDEVLRESKRTYSLENIPRPY